MSFPAAISTTAIEYVIGCLVPLLLAGVGGEEATARALALELLASHSPQNPHELRLACKIVGLSLQGLAKLVDSAAPGITPEKQDVALKWACSLTRTSQAGERRLEELQSMRRARNGQQAENPVIEPAALQPQAPFVAELHTPEPPVPEAPAADPSPAQAPPDVPQAEAKLKSAEKLLELMKAHHKGAPPPPTKAAQDIRSQERVLGLARMALAQARKSDQRAVQQPEAAHA